MAVALDLGLEHLYFVVPLKHFILLVSNLQTELGCSRITFTNVEPELLVLRYDLCFNIIKRYLGLKDSDASIDIEDLDNQWDLIVFNLELELWIGILGGLTTSWSRLPMLVALVADNVRVLHASQVLSADHSDEQVAHWTLDVPVVLSLGISQLFLGLLKSLMVHHDLRLYFVLTLN